MITAKESAMNTAVKHIDPVCGMSVNANPEKHYLYAGKDYYLCGMGCRTKFAADPGHYLQRSAPRYP